MTTATEALDAVYAAIERNAKVADAHTSSVAANLQALASLVGVLEAHAFTEPPADPEPLDAYAREWAIAEADLDKWIRSYNADDPEPLGLSIVAYVDRQAGTRGLVHVERPVGGTFGATRHIVERLEVSP